MKEWKVEPYFAFKCQQGEGGGTCPLQKWYKYHAAKKVGGLYETVKLYVIKITKYVVFADQIISYNL